MRIINRLSVAICLVLCWYGHVHSAPAVTGASGTVSNGQSITISGSDFGSHALNVESLSANIEAGTVGSNFSKSNWTNNVSGQAAHKYASDRSWSGGKSLKVTLDGSSNFNGVLEYNMPDVAPQEMFYATWWVYYTGDTSGQWKMLRIMPYAGGYSDGDTQAQWFNWFGGNQQRVQSGENFTKYSTGPWPQPNGWYRMEVKALASSVGSANGLITTGMYDPSGNYYSDLGQTRVESGTDSVRTYNGSDRWTHLVWQNYIGNGINNATIWFDDHYVQHGTQARIELCSGSSWANRGKCEIQVPTSWGTSSITATVNTGNFSGSSTAYIYVVDSAGDANTSGYSVTIGGSGGDVCDSSHLGLCLSEGACTGAGGYWYNNTCNATAQPTCSDGIQNGDETGVDCGGSCSACSAVSMPIGAGSMPIGAGSMPISVQ